MYGKSIDHGAVYLMLILLAIRRTQRENGQFQHNSKALAVLRPVLA